ncbi:MAG: hypothetical protein EPO20_04245 [Betaproteobacteria bacterium]|nr:MAG: hypothetical protein EPO20_04245 [Betaproteobacteria bacterium]
MKAWRYLIALALVASGGAGAQLAPAAQELLLLAPQLQAFAGSPANFESLAGGLRASSFSQGIQDPTPEQLRAALIGGAVATPSGAKVLLRGVLENGRQS